MQKLISCLILVGCLLPGTAPMEWMIEEFFNALRTDDVFTERRLVLYTVLAASLDGGALYAVRRIFE